MAITDASLKQWHGKLHEKRFERADRNNLSIRVTPKGKVVFQIRKNGQRTDLGVYPEMSLMEARQIALDPKAHFEKKEIPVTIHELFERSISHSNRGSTTALYRTVYLKHIYPEIGDKNAHTVTARELDTMLHKIFAHSQSVGGTALTILKRLYRFADRLDVKVTYMVGSWRVSDFIKPVEARKRILSPKEVHRIVVHDAKGVLNRRVHAVIMTLLCIGCRSGELRLAVKMDFKKNGNWYVPRDKHKSGDSMQRGLSRPIVDYVRPYIEFLMKTSPDPDYLCYMEQSAFSQKITRYLREAIGIDCTVHDLRRTMRTYVAPLCPPHVAEVMIGHTIKGVSNVYDHYDYIEEQREAYERYADLLRDFSGVATLRGNVHKLG